MRRNCNSVFSTLAGVSQSVDRTGLTSQVVFPSKFAVQIAVNVMLTLNFPLIENKTTFQIQYLQI